MDSPSNESDINNSPKVVELQPSPEISPKKNVQETKHSSNVVKPKDVKKTTVNHPKLELKKSISRRKLVSVSEPLDKAMEQLAAGLEADDGKNNFCFLYLQVV